MLRTLLLAAATAALLGPSVPAQQCRTGTVGVRGRTATSRTGYLLLQPEGERTTWLLDRSGRELQRWSAAQPVRDASLGADGLLLRSLDVGNPEFAAHPGAGGRVELVDWDGRVVWHLDVSTPTQCQHHAALRLADGDVAVLVWERLDATALAAAGRDPALLPASGYLLDHRVLRIRPDLVAGSGGATVWEWRALDHAIQDRDPTAATFGAIAASPGRIDLHYARDPRAATWADLHGLDVDPGRSELLLSARGFDEVWVVDFATDTAAARGAAGHLRYRWGNPEAYGRGGLADRRIDGPLAARWMPPGHADAGRIAICAAGGDRGWSSLDILAPARDSGGAFLDPGSAAFAPPALAAQHRAPTPEAVFSTTAGHVAAVGVDGIAIGALGNGALLEFGPAGEARFDYVSPWSAAGPLTQCEPIDGPAGARANRLAAAGWLPIDHPGLVGRTLTPGDVLERGYGVEVLTAGGSANGGAIEHRLCVSFETLLLPLRLRDARPGALGALVAAPTPQLVTIPPTGVTVLGADPWLVATFRLDAAGTTMWPIVGEFATGADVWLQFGTFADGPLGLELASSPLVRMWRR